MLIMLFLLSYVFYCTHEFVLVCIPYIFIKIESVHYLSRCYELLGCCICRIPK